jgi:hypothetical protein
MERTIVQLVLVNDTGDSFYRMRWPGAELAKQNPNWRIINLDAQAKERFEWGLNADLLVLLQSSDLDLLWLVEERKKLGKKTLVEYNDNFYHPQPWSPVVDAWNSPLIWQSYELLMSSADAMMVTGPGLQQLFKEHYSGPIHEIENNFPRPLPDFKLLWSEPGERIKIGWAGSLGHMADIISVRDVIAKILEEFPQADFCVMGNESLPEVLQLPKERFQSFPWGSMEDYIRFWGPIHIGIAPLLDTPYNNCRSDIKAVEMSASGAVSVLSNALPYRKFIKETNVPSFDSPKALYEVLKSLLKKPKDLKAIAERSYNYVRDSRIGPNRKERAELFQSLIGEIPSSNYRFPFPLGYHEVMGTSQPEPPSRQAVLAVQQLLNQKRIQEGRQLLDQVTAQHPKHPELQLAKFKLTLGQNREEGLKLLPNLKKQFPRDLRFSISELMGESDKTKFNNRLFALLMEFERLEPKNRSIFLFDFLLLLRRGLNKFPIEVEALGRASELFPTSPEISLLYAQSLTTTGRTIEAVEIYGSLRERLQKASDFDELRKQIGPGFLAAWEEGLKGR